MADVKMSVREFLAHKMSVNFDGFATNRFDEIQYFEEYINDLGAAGVDLDDCVVPVMTDDTDEESILYADTLLIPFTEEIPFEVVEILLHMAPDEFEQVDNYIRLWWD